MVWQSDASTQIQKHLSSHVVADRIDTPEADSAQSNKEITIDDCFKEFEKEEILDEDNMWYCNKCKVHV